jgi:hypothetical protein
VFTSLSVKFKAGAGAGVEDGEVGGGDGGEDELAKDGSLLLPPSPPLQLGADTPSTMRTAIATWHKG